MKATLTCVRWCIVLVLICMSLLVNDVEYIFVCVFLSFKNSYSKIYLLKLASSKCARF